jgi:hypothetical protein
MKSLLKSIESVNGSFVTILLLNHHEDYGITVTLYSTPYLM